VALFDAFEQTHGHRRIHAELLRRRVPCSAELVADIMRELGLRACQPRAYRVTTIQGDDPVDVPDLLERDFTAGEPGTKFVGDITYIRTWQGWLYLATVIDCATKMVVGWSVADHMRTTAQRSMGCAEITARQPSASRSNTCAAPSTGTTETVTRSMMTSILNQRSVA